MYIAIKVVIKNGNCKRPWHINPLRLKDFPLFLLESRLVYEKEFSISLTTRTGLVIKQSFEP